MPEVTFRMVKSSDSDILLAWRNDAESIRNSLHQGEVTNEDHIAWMKKIIGSADSVLLIAEVEGKPVGAFRMDKFYIVDVGASPDTRLISYVVSPEHRRKGLGRAIVAEGCVCYGQEYNLIAKIRQENRGSKSILESCDFQCLGEIERGILAYLRPNDRTDTVQ